MEEYYLMWLSRIDGIGIKRVQMLLKHFGTAEAVWRTDKSELSLVVGLPEKVVNAILFSRDREKLEVWIEELEEMGIQFYSFYHPKYPTLLKEIYHPPIGIYVKGTLPDDDIDRVAVVGARNCSRYGATTAYTITKDLGKTNVVVVSGMAKGIDSMAHKGILDGGGQTIAVLGCGLDICYPAENLELMHRIANNGCVISEYPPGTKALPGNFPSRNRIISGLSKLVVVVEAGKRSGTLITADLALESGRDVFVVPGNVTSALSEGTNNLIKQGCPIITEGNDILFELGISYKIEEKERFCQKVAKSLAPEEKEVYDLIQDKEPVLGDDICRKLGHTIQEVQYILSLLEIAGYIRKLPQAGYIRES